MHHSAVVYSLFPDLSREKSQWSSYDPREYQNIQTWATKYNIQAMTKETDDIHYKLLSIRPKVSILYYMGNIKLLDTHILWIVGPRKMSPYGQMVTENLFIDMHQYDIATVSGMAEGIDQLGHTLSLHQHIPTIAVLWGGIGRYLNRAERTLLQQIVQQGGLVVSEYKLFEQPKTYTFPQRNRLIAGIADMVFLPEAGQKSWSLITVGYALSMHKPVYATPNSIFAPTSAGVLSMIAQGKITAVVDIAKFLSTHFTPKRIQTDPTSLSHLTDQEQALIQSCTRGKIFSPKDIVSQNGGDIQDVMQVLTMLELKDMIIQHSPWRYTIR